MSIAEWLDTGKVNDLPILSAKEARMLTEKYMEETITSQLGEIGAKIAYAAKNGDESVTLEGTLNKNVREKLEKILEYKIETGTQYNESYYTISW
nr:MAG TPA: hypothetical protein [Caudoviricetes sp.]